MICNSPNISPSIFSNLHVCNSCLQDQQYNLDGSISSNAYAEILSQYYFRIRMLGIRPLGKEIPVQNGVIQGYVIAFLLFSIKVIR